MLVVLFSSAFDAAEAAATPMPTNFVPPPVITTKNTNAAETKSQERRRLSFRNIIMTGRFFSSPLYGCEGV
jgi:hypothetical protein